jgi:hypothetical protein
VWSISLLAAWDVRIEDFRAIFQNDSGRDVWWLLRYSDRESTMKIKPLGQA